LSLEAEPVGGDVSCKLTGPFTGSGTTARLVPPYRPHPPVAAITYNEDTYRRLALWWGVVPVKSEFAQTTDEMIVAGEALLKSKALVAAAGKILMLAGQSHTPGATHRDP